MRCALHSKERCLICFPQYAQTMQINSWELADNNSSKNVHNEFSESYAAHDGCGYDSSNVLPDFNCGNDS